MKNCRARKMRSGTSTGRTRLENASFLRLRWRASTPIDWVANKSSAVLHIRAAAFAISVSAPMGAEIPPSFPRLADLVCRKFESVGIGKGAFCLIPPFGIGRDLTPKQTAAGFVVGNSDP